MTTGTASVARDTRISIRLRDDELRVLREAATRHALPVASFMRSVAVRHARGESGERAENGRRAVR